MKLKTYKYEFDPKDCNTIHFKKILKILNKVNPEKEEYIRMSKKKINNLNIKCYYDFIKNCERDEFFFEKKTQIILGRFNDTIGCFYDCKNNYFAMAMDPYSIFKNDIFIRYMVDKTSIFIKNIDHKLETIFPIRILLSNRNLITTHKLKKLLNLDEYYSEINPITKNKKKAISNYNLNIILNMNKKMNKITEVIPINHIIGRELCLLYYLNYYFYIVEVDENNIKPFILVSKFNLKIIKNIYSKYLKKSIPNIKLLFKSHSIKKLNEDPIKSLCIKYKYLTIQDNFSKAKQMVYQNIENLDYTKYNNTINFLWKYVGYFIIITSDADLNIRSYFFQNRTKDKPEIKLIKKKIEKYYGKDYLNILNKEFPLKKTKILKKLYKILSKKNDKSLSTNYNKINLEKIYDLVIMNNIIWQWNHSYESSDYYTSTYINLFRHTIKRGKLKNKIFFVNYFDRPVLHKKYKYYLVNKYTKHNINDYMKIYSPTTNNNYQDIPIPTPDLWLITTKIIFGDSCSNNYQEEPVKISYSKKKNKIVFRGTNTSLYPNDIKKNSRLYFMNLINNNKNKFKKNFFDVGITNLSKSNILNKYGEIVYSDIDKIKEQFPDFKIVPYIPMNEQLKYKYILDLDGIASAWRLPYYFKFKSTIFKQESEFKEYYYYYPEFKKAVIFFNKKNLIKKIDDVLNKNINGELIAKKSYLFYKKYFNKEEILNYMISITY